MRCCSAFLGLFACFIAAGADTPPRPLPQAPPPVPVGSRPLHRLGGPILDLPEGFGGFQWSPNSKAVLLGNRPLAVILDVETGRQLYQIEIAYSGVYFFPSGREVLCTRWFGRELRTARHDLVTGEHSWVMRQLGDLSTFEGVLIQDKTVYLINRFDVSIRVWDLEEDKLVRKVDTYSKKASQNYSRYDFVPSVERIATVATSSSNGETSVWIQVVDVATGKQISEWRARGPDKQNHGLGVVALSRDGKSVFYGGSDGVQAYDADSGKLLHEFTIDWCRRLAASPDGKLLASYGADGITLWDLVTRKKVRVLPVPSPGTSYDIKFSPDSRRLAAGGGEDRVLEVWDVATGELMFPADAGHRRPVESVAFTPDGKQLLSWGHGERMVWELGEKPTAKRLRPIEPLNPDKLIWFPSVLYSQFHRSKQWLAVHPGGKWVADPYGMWELPGWNLAHEFKDAPGAGDTIAVSPDGELVALIRGIEVLVWSVKTRTVVHKLTRPEFARRASLHALTFTPDGRTVIATGIGEYVLSWDVASGKLLRRVIPPEGDISTISLTPDGQWLVCGATYERIPGDRKTVRVIERASGQLVRGWSPRPGETVAVAVSPCGRFLATAGHEDDTRMWPRGRSVLRPGDRFVRVWNLFTGEEVAAFEGHRGPVNCVAWSADGKMLASGSDDATVLVWDTSKLVFKLPQSPKPDKPAVWWDRLDGTAKVAADATLEMLAHPADAVAVLGPRLLATPKADEKVIAEQIKDVIEGDFQNRTSAAKALGEYDIEATAGPIRAALKDDTPAEARAELSRLLGEVPGLHTQHIRRLRAVRALEQIGSKEARAVLADLAKRADAPALAREAGLAHQRLGNKP